VNSPCDLQGQLERDVRDPEERRARDLQAQRGLLALAERFLILHASKIVALMMFWAAMAQPGAIGWLLLGMKLPCIYLRQYIHLNDVTVLNAASWAAFSQLRIPVPGLKLVRGRILNTVYFRHGASERAFRLPNIMESSFSLAKQSTQ